MAYRVTLVPRQINGETVAPRPYSDKESSETWGRQKKKKQKVGNVLGLSPHWGLQSMGCSRQGVLGCRVWGLFFPFAHVQRQLPPGKAGRGVGQECILPLGNATLPTLQLSTHRRSSEESEETRDRRSPRISAKGGKGLVTTCSPAGSC